MTNTPMTTEPIVYIVDDDDELCTSLAWLLDSVDISSQKFNDAASSKGTTGNGPRALSWTCACRGPVDLRFRKP